MKIFGILSVLIFLLIAGGINVNGQCKDFAKKTCIPELGSYTHDGNYHAAVLVEGEEAELYKTFYSGMEYRIAVCGGETLPQVEFIVCDADKETIYTNKDANYAKTWDFKLESSQQLRIVIKVNSAVSNSEGMPASGCVSIMFGFKIKQ